MHLGEQRHGEPVQFCRACDRLVRRNGRHVAQMPGQRLALCSVPTGEVRAVFLSFFGHFVVYDHFVQPVSRQLPLRMFNRWLAPTGWFAFSTQKTQISHASVNAAAPSCSCRHNLPPLPVSQRQYELSIYVLQVLALTAELAGLGGGDIAVGCGWVGALTPPGSAVAAAAAASLDACCGDAGSLCTALQEVRAESMHGRCLASLDGFETIALSLATCFIICPT